MLKVLAAGWRRWLAIATVIGNFQMIVLLSLFYWTIVFLTSIPLKLFSNPLGLRRRSSSPWIDRPPVRPTPESMRRQG